VQRDKPKTPIDMTAAKLREIALATPEGELIGSEDSVLEQIGVSRVTVRQAARLLEREGVLRVRRGINGGYFSSRPSAELVEQIVCTYLETLGLDTRHVGAVANALWIEVMREAASTKDRAAARELADKLTAEIQMLGDDATSEDVSRIEQASKAAVFQLIEGQYVELIFRINLAFARQQVIAKGAAPDPDAHREFVSRWKKAKILELEAIADGDPSMAMTAARHSRNLWERRGRRSPAS
jgi:DNA-binding FadR family transcriptional regulator